MASRFNNEEHVPLMADVLRTEPEIKPWDVFKDPPIKVETGSMEESKWIDLSIKILKLLTYVVTFAVVLGGGAISKGTLLFMTSQIGINQTKPYCNKDLDRNKQFVVQLPVEERVAWMWILVFTFFAPEAVTFLRSLRILLFKNWKMPTTIDLFSVLITETLPTIGSAILVFCILPDLDVVKGAMLTNAVCFVPAIVGLFSRNPSENQQTFASRNQAQPENRNPSENQHTSASRNRAQPKSKTKSHSGNLIKMALDVFSVLAQLTAFVVWPILENKPSMWLIPVSIVLISCGWWENYVSEDSPIYFIKKLGRAKKSFENSRYFIYLFVSVWKCLVFFICFIFITMSKEGSVDFLFDDFDLAFREHFIIVTEVRPIIGDKTAFNISDILQITGTQPVRADYLTPVWVFLINILATYICYAFGKFACKIMIQGFGYAFPINLTMPFTISLLIAACGVFNADECAFHGTIPSYLFYNIPSVYFLRNFIASDHTWIWLFWLLSQTWVTIHIWTPHCEKLARTEKLYVKPMFDAYLIDQSIALNRRRDDKPENDDEDDDGTPKKEQEDGFVMVNNSIKKREDEITRIYACGTMWHETKEEMMEFLKSIMRLDEDQCAHRLVREQMGIDRPDYYEIETHVFFDDAFIRTSEDDNDPMVNIYVKTLCLAMDDAASEVHQTRMRVRPPKKYITPYGGRLVWILPGQTRLYAHLKDKKKIRPKKRWSQVMYMYYLLGHRLMEVEELSNTSKDKRADNTYLLALDGDIDFQPEAVHLLVSLMKKNKSLGAACGRIHPLGSGPMVWYQMFEYAIGHWLQKATEHMIGCVLCSPGCFSLFRAKALMDHNVMKRYTKRSEEARHFVQYDQGEDRWLCTLLLQRGYRVEYSAASDAFTHCPEGFNEFYNQRRRWMPSTTANILDLLMDAKRTIKINDSISRPYIGYQMLLMIGTVLGPGTIFLMLIGAFVAAFQMDQWSSFLWNAVPILIFMGACILFDSKVQLLFAGVISAVYGLVMMAVLVGVMLQISNDGVLAPSSLFFFCIAGEMIVTAMLHPKEFGCLIYGIVYYVTVPSMYMLLVIYSVFNLNNVSWGTREVTVEEKVEEEPKAEENAPKKDNNKIISLFGDGENKKKAGSLELSIAGLFKCMLCTHPKEEPENVQLLQLTEELKKMSEKLDNMERTQREDPSYVEDVPRKPHVTFMEGPELEKLIDLDKNSYDSDKKSDISDSVEPNNWLDQEALGHGEFDCISTPERLFWEGLLDRYLHPIEDNKEQVARDLKDLRDKAVMAFFMLNALFVLVVFLLTLKKDLLHVKWPLDVKVNFTYIDAVDEIVIYRTYLELEPIGFVFLIFFALLLVVQFVAMLLHRFGTFSQILASTYIDFETCSQSPKKRLTDQQILESDPLRIVKKWMKIRGVDDEDEEEEEKKEEPRAGRRKTVKNLGETGYKRQSITDLTQAFERRLTKTAHSKNPGMVGRKSMAAAINNRRRSTMHRNNRSSMVRFNVPNSNLSQGYVNNGYAHSESGV